MRKTLFMIAALLLAVWPVQGYAATTPEGAVMEALEACMAHQQGAPLVPQLTALGYGPSKRAEGRWVRQQFGLEYQVWLADKPLKNGKTHRLCSVGVWGRMASIGRAESAAVAKVKAMGFTPGPVTPGKSGGTEQFIPRNSDYSALMISLNSDRDSNTGANYIFIYGWVV